jgi:hypothetical protein
VVDSLLRHNAGSLITVPAAAFLVGMSVPFAIPLTVTMIAFLLWRARRATPAVLAECGRPAGRRRI